jgi:hypothetical protein
MENKKVIIGLGVLAIAGIGYYMWKKNKTENNSNVSGKIKVDTFSSYNDTTGGDSTIGKSRPQGILKGK